MMPENQTRRTGHEGATVTTVGVTGGRGCDGEAVWHPMPRQERTGQQKCCHSHPVPPLRSLHEPTDIHVIVARSSAYFSGGA